MSLWWGSIFFVLTFFVGAIVLRARHPKGTVPHRQAQSGEWVPSPIVKLVAEFCDVRDIAWILENILVGAPAVKIQVSLPILHGFDFVGRSNQATGCSLFFRTNSYQLLDESSNFWKSEIVRERLLGSVHIDMHTRPPGWGFSAISKWNRKLPVSYSHRFGVRDYCSRSDGMRKVYKRSLAFCEGISGRVRRFSCGIGRLSHFAQLPPINPQYKDPSYREHSADSYLDDLYDSKFSRKFLSLLTCLLGASAGMFGQFALRWS